jgi:AcrR family transcriptional regulator
VSGAGEDGPSGRRLTASVDAGSAKSDRNGAGDGHIAAIQRARIVRAMLEVCSAYGAANVTVATIVEQAGISRRTFYELFHDVDECFLATFQEARRRLGARVLPAWREPGLWHERLRAALVQLLAFLDHDRLAGRLVLVEASAAAPRALELRRELFDHAVAAVEAGRSETKAARDLSPLTGEGIVGGVVSVLQARLSGGEEQPLVELTGPLMSMIVLPYLGPLAARREARRPLPLLAPEEPAPTPGRGPLGELEIRITYRTVRVLAAIAARPGASNREIGRVAGIEDQGQTSKLLARLEKAGLLENVNAHGVRGLANAWTLTALGAEVQRAMSPASEIGA